MIDRSTSIMFGVIDVSAGLLLLIIISVAIVIDVMIGDPVRFPHPVRVMGNVITVLERRLNGGQWKKGKGVGLVLIVVGAVYGISFAAVYGAYHVHAILGVLVEIYIIWTAIAIKGLQDAAQEVAMPLAQNDFSTARERLSRIVGRDTESLSESEIARGTVETVAENTVDGITAPIFFAMMGGAPLAIAYRAVNTLDSMVGHRNERYLQFGWTSAKLDDLLNWIPARLSAIAMWIAAIVRERDRSNFTQPWKITLRDASKHPSPNSGWSETMMAALLGVQLGGVNTYQGVVSERAPLGDPTRPLVQQDISQAITYMHGCWIGFTLFLYVIYFIFIAMF